MSIADTLAPTDSVSSTIEKWSSRLIDVSHTIHAHPELAFEEHRASALLADAAQEAGFTVTRAAYGLETAFEAVRGSGPSASSSAPNTTPSPTSVMRAGTTSSPPPDSEQPSHSVRSRKSTA
ncbi:hypothetical protein GCM10020255_073780 [Rhodococcus baikonurensis]